MGSHSRREGRNVFPPTNVPADPLEGSKPRRRSRRRRRTFWDRFLPRPGPARRWVLVGTLVALTTLAALLWAQWDASQPVPSVKPESQDKTADYLKNLDSSN